MLDGKLSIGVLVSFVLYLGRFFQPIQLLGAAVQRRSSRDAVSIIRLRELSRRPERR